eukprot:1262891-Amphidinium_carterae.1
MEQMSIGEVVRVRWNEVPCALCGNSLRKSEVLLHTPHVKQEFTVAIVLGIASFSGEQNWRHDPRQQCKRGWQSEVTQLQAARRATVACPPEENKIEVIFNDDGSEAQR